MEEDLQRDVQLRVDDGDNDSAYAESDTASITTSLKSSAFDYVYEAGPAIKATWPICNRSRMDVGISRLDRSRTFFDDTEKDRLDMLHHIFRLVQGGRLYTASLSDPHRVLDMGTGTGIWAVHFADEFPNSEIVGVDNDPMQPQWVPPNCQFLVDNLEDEWDYKPGQEFDYIHQRNMCGSISDWTKLYKQAWAHLRPSGWLEIQEFEVWFQSQKEEGLPEGSAIQQWQTLLDEASSKMGSRLNYATSFEKNLEEAGFTDIQARRFKTPIGSWPADKRMKTIGIFLQAQMLEAVDAVTPPFFNRVLGWKPEETQILIGNLKKEFNSRSLQLYTYCWFYTARKPEDKGV